MDPLTIGMALAQFAPSLIKLLSGSDKAADVAEKVIDVAKAVTGKPDAEAAIAELHANPDKVLEFRAAIAAQQTDLEKAYLADKKSARELQAAALGQDDLFSKRFVYYFAMGWSVFAMVYFGAVTFLKVPEAGVRIADTILGVLIGTILTGLFQFFYGSTARNGKKDDTIQALVGMSK